MFKFISSFLDFRTQQTRSVIRATTIKKTPIDPRTIPTNSPVVSPSLMLKLKKMTKYNLELLKEIY